MNRQLINNLSDSTALQVNYPEYEEVSGQWFPMEEKMVVFSPRDTTKVELKHSKVKLNEPVKMPFKINSKYARIN